MVQPVQTFKQESGGEKPLTGRFAAALSRGRGLRVRMAETVKRRERSKRVKQAEQRKRVKQMKQ